MTLEEYRAQVREVTCPFCNARPASKCWKAPRPGVGTFDTTVDTFTEVDYVHDDRSLAWHNVVMARVRV